MTSTSPELIAVAACPLCDCTTSSVWKTIRSWRLRRCAQCGLGRLDPRPALESLASLYDDAYFDDRVPTEPPERAARRTRRLMTRRMQFVQRFQRGGRLLDAGCGEGDFLAAARAAGFLVQGCDVSAVAAAVARERHGLEFAVGAVGEVELPGPFDVITAWHVLEHVPNPLAAMRWCHSLLDDGGVLIVETPNAESFDAQRFGEAWDGWQPPVHLWHFGAATLRALLLRAGFVPVKMRYEASSYVRRRLGRFPLIKTAKGVLAHLQPGTSVAIAAKKMSS